MGAIKTPELYQCAASLNGVTDMFAWLSARRRQTPIEVLRMTIGDRYRDRERLLATSPLQNASKIAIPVLVAHGDKDRVVPVTHSRRMIRALERLDKPVEPVIIEGGNHAMNEPIHRKQMLLALERFLARHLAPAMN